MATLMSDAWCSTLPKLNTVCFCSLHVYTRQCPPVQKALKQQHNSGSHRHRGPSSRGLAICSTGSNSPMIAA